MDPGHRNDGTMNKPIYLVSVAVAVVCLVLGNFGLAIAVQAGGRVQEMVLGLTSWAAIILWGDVILVILTAGLERVVKGRMTGLESCGLAALNLLPAWS